MFKPRTTRWLICLTIGCSVLCAARPARVELFEFRNNPWVNLHLFLYQTARARLGLDRGRLTTVATLDDTIGFGALPPDRRAAWEESVAYYVTAIARRDVLFDSSLVDVTDRLSELALVAPSRGG